jgi:uncharacterized protein (DUF1330 family)
MGVKIMKPQYAMGLSVLAGVAIGALAVQGLHAQAAKLKAYSIAEIESVSGKTVSAGYLKDARDAIEKAHGHALKTVNGKVVRIEGTAPPTRVAIVEWESLDDAVNFYTKSPDWAKLASERNSAQKTLRRYVVEVEQ